jgi:hypothetical protein
MPALVTSNFRIHNAQQFINSFNEPEWGGFRYPGGVSYVYLFIGKATSWDTTHAGYSDTVIPSPDGDVQGNAYEPWRDMIALDRVANTDVLLAAKRTDWVTGEVYEKYDDQDPGVAKGTKNFFVYTGSGVFKCLDNNGGAPSTARPDVPSSQLQDVFTNSDGYRWKYMYDFPQAVGDKFLSTNYIPVRTLNNFTIATESLWTDLATVQQYANVGTLEAFSVVAGGSGFTAHSGGIPDATRIISSNTVSATGPWDTVTLTADVVNLGTPSADLFAGAVIVIYTSSGITHVSPITASTAAATPVLTLEKTLLVTDGEQDGYLYHIGPRLDVTGDGQGANIYSIMTTSGSAPIASIGVIGAGNNYTTASVTVIAPTEDSGVVLSQINIRPIISPPGGHGSDAVRELNGWNVIMHKKLTGSLLQNPDTKVSNTWPISNEYRTIGLVRNPLLSNGYSVATAKTPGESGANWYANATPIHQSTWITVNSTASQVGSNYAPLADDEVKGVSSLATARVVEYNAGDNYILNLTNVVANTSGGTFLDWEKIGLKSRAGVSSPDSATTYVTANGYVEHNEVQVAHDGTTRVSYEPELVANTGEILYLEHRAPITRSADQSEDIKVIIEF